MREVSQKIPGSIDGGNVSEWLPTGMDWNAAVGAVAWSRLEELKVECHQ